jgi:hypothetical protein
MQAQAQSHFISIDKRDIGMLQTKLFQCSQVERVTLNGVNGIESTPSLGMKISYEINTYKKVSADMFYIIPRGKKCIVWLTMYKNLPEAIFFDLDPKDHTKIKFVSIRTLHPRQHFDIVHFQGRGTVLYGTLLLYDSPETCQQQLFAIENIHVYENQNVDSLTVIQKDELMYKLLSSSRDKSFGCLQARLQSCVLFGVAVKYSSYSETLKAVNTPSIVPYPVYAIQGRFKNQTDNKYYQNCQTCQSRPPIHQPEQPQQRKFTTQTFTPTFTPFKQPVQQQYPQQLTSVPTATNTFTKVFMVKADPRVDTYRLRCPETNIVEPEPAHVGDYKTSVFLNSIFRNVKENLSLDAAEESDDEESFQSSQEKQEMGFIRYSDIEKAMVCSYNYKFKRWIPLRLDA